MRIIFAGTPEFAATSLNTLLASTHSLELVLTQPDRRSGRGKRHTASPVKQLAKSAGLPIQQPSSLSDPALQQQLQNLDADIMIVVAYGLIIPQAVLDIPRLGCINVHASLLPEWRGAAPIQRAIAAGDSRTGISIMQMDAGLDTGPVIHQSEMPIHDTDTGGSLHDKLAKMGANNLLKVLQLSDLSATPQPEGASYAHKLSKKDGKIDWTQSADSIYNQIRAFNPWPVASSRLDDLVIRIWSACPVNQSGSPGTILAATEDGLVVAAGQKALCLQTLQLPGKPARAATDLLNGYRDLFQPGKQFQ